MEIAKQTPPIDNSGSRFGNPAFRTFYDRVGEVCVCLSVTDMTSLTDQVRQAADKLHTKIPGFPVEALPEVTVYFRESWGDRTRVDYGSGMELNFLCWL
jgi:serine/threonine-protein phosphatase 2A activator